MQNPDQDKQDQSNSGMEDSTAMTIEFLRARLLAERSVSKTARQRAEELAKRVMELEEQLRIVSVQRKKAERATAEVLAILETRGISSDFSEDYYSSSDQEATSQDDSRKGEVSVNSKLRRPDSEELSGTEHDSAISGRSLSWKGCKDSSRSYEKYKDSSIKRRSSFASAVRPSKHHLGKSCRQIKRREQRFESTEKVNESVKVNYRESETATSSERSSQITDKEETFRETAESQEDVLHKHHGPNTLEDDINVINNVHELKTYGGESDMERALERQAQLIGQYEAMEKAQREWEERYGENNSSAPDSCDPGNHSDTTEERDELKSQALFPPASVPEGAREVNSTAEDACDRLPGSQPDVLPHISKAGHSSGGHAHPDDFPDKSRDVAMSNEKQKQNGAENSLHVSSQRTHDNSTLLLPSQQFSSPAVDTLQKGEASGRQTENSVLVPHETGGRLNGVLDALQQAKSMIQRKISLEPTTQGGLVGKAWGPYLHSSDCMEKLDIPAGCPGLFRLPTDFSSETIKSDYRNSSAHFSLTSHYPEHGASSSANTQYLNHPYMESRAVLPIFNKFLGNPMINAGSRTVTSQLPTNPYLDHIEPPPFTPPYMDHTIPPRYIPSVSYPVLMPRTFASDGFPRTLSSSAARTLPRDIFSFHDGDSRPYMYR